jgi:hypothetical protein
MQMVQFQEPRPPYVRFETRAIERRDSAGNTTWVNVDYVVVTPQGSRNNVEKIVKEWWPVLESEVRQGRFYQSWLQAYKEAYKAFLEGQEAPVNGTPIRNWSMARPAEVKILDHVGIKTVEDLAEANEEVMQNIGMGALSLRNRARDFVQAQATTGPLVLQMDALRVENSQLKADLDVLRGEMKTLQEAMNVQKKAIDMSVRSGQPVESPEDQLSVQRAMADSKGPRDETLIADAIKEVLDE